MAFWGIVSVIPVVGGDGGERGSGRADHWGRVTEHEAGTKGKDGQRGTADVDDKYATTQPRRALYPVSQPQPSQSNADGTPRLMAGGFALLGHP